MGAFVKNMYQKSLLFEIINIKTNDLVDSFTLTIPPDTMELTQPQRVKRTKTFGGFFEDDYGLDNGKLTISGNTGGTDKRTTYQSTKGVSGEEYHGEKAITYFYDNIIKYKERNDTFQDLEVRIYDLNSSYSESPAESSYSMDPSSTQGFIVSFDDFKLARNKDKPLFYSYNLECFVVAYLGRKRIKKKQNYVPPKRTALKAFITNLRSALNSVKNTMAKIKSVFNQLQQVNSLLNDLDGQINSYMNIAEDLNQQGLSIISLKNVQRVSQYPASHAKAVLDMFNTMFHDYQEEVENTPEIFESIGEENYYNSVSILTKMESQIHSLVVFGKTKQARNPELLDITSIVADGSSEEAKMETVTIYGFSIEIATSGTSLDFLASKYYGDPSYSRLIADFNGLSEDDLSPGTIIKIPRLTEAGSNNDNLIFDWDGKDNFGKDIKIDSSSRAFVISESGDYVMTEGKSNFAQAINLRLNEILGKRIRLTYYGLRTSVGNSADRTPVVYLVTNVKDTLMQDPRVASVGSVFLKGDGDKLYVTTTIYSSIGTIENITGVIE